MDVRVCKPPPPPPRHTSTGYWAAVSPTRGGQVRQRPRLGESMAVGAGPAAVGGWRAAVEDSTDEDEVGVGGGGGVRAVCRNG